MEIKNSKDDAIKGGKWSKPSASFYDRLLAEDNYKSLINEAFLVVRNVDKDTSFSASGCKYPHHSIKNGELVVNEAGVRAAYSRAKQMGVYRGSLKEHLDCHLHELGIIKEEKHIEENFNDIFQYLEIPNVTNEGTQIVEPKDDSIEESLDWIDQFVYSDAFRESVDVFEEKSHGPLKYCYRIGFDADTGKEVAIQFILDSSKVNKVGTNYDPDLQKDAVAAVKKTIKKYGHIDFTSEDSIKLGSKNTKINEKKSRVSGNDYLFKIGNGTIRIKDAANQSINVIDYAGNSHVYNVQAQYTELFDDDKLFNFELDSIIETNFDITMNNQNDLKLIENIDCKFSSDPHNIPIIYVNGIE